MNIVNLTSHVYFVAGEKIEPSGLLARIWTDKKEVAVLERDPASKKISLRDRGKTTEPPTKMQCPLFHSNVQSNLPPPRNKTRYIVSTLVRMAYPDRKDLLSVVNLRTANHLHAVGFVVND